MSNLNEKLESRRRNHKKGIDPEEARRKREELTIELRKNKREEMVHKRRLKSDGTLISDENIIDNNNDKDEDALNAEILEYMNNLPLYAQMIKSPEPALQLQATQCFRKVLSIEKQPPIQTVIDVGIMPFLVSFLQNENEPTLQFEAAWALTNIASGSAEHTQFVIQSGAVPILIALLRSAHEEVREQVVWCLGNIAGDSSSCRDILLHCGIMPNLLALCNVQSRLGVLRNVINLIYLYFILGNLDII